MRQPRAALVCLLAVALATGTCKLRAVDVLPVSVGYEAPSASVAARLADLVHGLHESEGPIWAASYKGGNTILASLEWGTHYLRVVIRVDEGWVKIAVVESAGLNQHGSKIHKKAAGFLRSLRHTILLALRTERAALQLARVEARDAPFEFGLEIPAEEQARRLSAESGLPGPQPSTNQTNALPEGLTFGGYFALIVGNDRYAALPDLRTALADALAVGTVLEDEYNFEIELLANAGRSKIVSALNRYRTRLSERDNLLVYYAGHGWFDEEAQRGYWLPADAAERDPANWISNATVTALIKAIPAKHVIVVADSCYSGTLTRGVKVRSPDPYLGALSLKRARTALTSGGLEPVEDGSGRHSVFATAFIRTLRENETVLDGQTLFALLRRPVMLEVDQTPEYADIRRAGHEGGDFLFVPARLQLTAP